ncbi:hypothetical protein GIB67_007767 [Kingdonia uniflora]|uniref:Serpin domain-containing protein n=1 Tax=Kingdonia uniflora TaxID=39325 RepID=A0A7J7N1X0_9MAGN|nr:hypothetical protein GIB67_007767 [Kingdonia uniflora]
MTTYADQIVLSFENFKGLRLPYKVTDDTKELSMYIFLPHKRDGLWNLVKKVASDSKFLTKHVRKLSRYVNVERFMIPKFKISFGFEASKVLKEGGLDLPFSKGDDAGLHGTVIEKRLRIQASEVLIEGGLHLPFSDGDDAGLHGTVIEKLLKVSKDLHRSFFVVNEEGTPNTGSCCDCCIR